MKGEGEKKECDYQDKRGAAYPPKKKSVLRRKKKEHSITNEGKMWKILKKIKTKKYIK